MSPSFSFELPTHRVESPKDFVAGAAIMELALAAERAGYSACHVTDHPAPDGKWLDRGGHHALDPFVALAFAAAATTDIKLLTNVLILGYRNPFLAAKSIQSLDVLSGGRLIVGTGAGYSKPEFAALGVDFEERNELLDEAIEVVKAVAGGEDTPFDGRHFSARGVRHSPRTVAQPHPPIWVGGNSTRAIRRAVSSCQGWAPFGTDGYGAASRTAEIAGPNDLVRRIGIARALCEQLARTEPLEICYSAGGLGEPGRSVEERRDLIGTLADAGVTWLTVSIPGVARAELNEGLTAFAETFIG